MSETEADFKCRCKAESFMFVDNVDFFESGFELDAYSAGILNYSSVMLALTPDETRIAAEFDGDGQAVETYVDALLEPYGLLLLDPALSALDIATSVRGRHIATLDRIAPALERSRAACLPCPSEGAICAEGTEFLDERRFPGSALKSASYYWQDDNLYFDEATGRGLKGALNYGGVDSDLQTEAEAAATATADSTASNVDNSSTTSFPAFENCFTDVCAEGRWSACAGNNSGILCNSCEDSTFCVDLKAGSNNGAIDVDGGNCNSSFLFEIMVGEDVRFAKDGYECKSCDQDAAEYVCPTLI